MVSRKALSLCALVAVAAGTVTAAQADVVASLSYQTLTGSFNVTGANTGVFSANASVGPANPVNSVGNSTGNVTREPAGGNASFSPGFVGLPDFSDFSLTLNVVGINAGGATVLPGGGSFTATDVLGNTITGSISGTWTFTGGGVQLAFFDGLLSNVNYTANNGNLFTGQTGAANMAGLLANLGGSMQITFLQSVPPPIFSVGLGGNGPLPVVSTVVQAQITPAPGALALLGVGGLVAARRRR